MRASSTWPVHINFCILPSSPCHLFITYTTPLSYKSQYLIYKHSLTKFAVSTKKSHIPYPKSVVTPNTIKKQSHQLSTSAPILFLNVTKSQATVLPTFQLPPLLISLPSYWKGQRTPKWRATMPWWIWALGWAPKWWAQSHEQVPCVGVQKDGQVYGNGIPCKHDKLYACNHKWVSDWEVWLISLLKGGSTSVFVITLNSKKAIYRKGGWNC